MDISKSCFATLDLNTKQWWVYSNDLDKWIDPPIFVHAEMRNKFGSPLSDKIGEQEDYLNRIIKANPDWLYDKDAYRDSKMFKGVLIGVLINDFGNKK